MSVSVHVSESRKATTLSKLHPAEQQFFVHRVASLSSPHLFRQQQRPLRDYGARAWKRARARRSAQQRGALRRSVQLKIRNFRALIDHRVDELLSSCAAPLPVIVRSSTIYGIVERSSRYCQRLKVFSVTAACR